MTPDPAAVPRGWQAVRLRDVARLTAGKAPTYVTGDIAQIPVIGANGRIGTTDRFNATLGVAVGRVGASGSVRRIDAPVWLSDNVLLVEPEVGLVRQQVPLSRIGVGTTPKSGLADCSAPHHANNARWHPPLPPAPSPSSAPSPPSSTPSMRRSSAPRRSSPPRSASATLCLHELLTRGLPGRHSAWADVPGLGTVPACWEVVRLGDVGRLALGWDAIQGTP